MIQKEKSYLDISKQESFATFSETQRFEIFVKKRSVTRTQLTELLRANIKIKLETNN